MRTALNVIMVLMVCIFSGCNGASVEKELLTVDFQQSRTLRYQFISSREIAVITKSESKQDNENETVDRYSETMEMVVAYTPIEINPYGLTTVKATCESVKVTRSLPRGGSLAKDALESLTGETFIFTVSPTGRIEDYSQLDKLIRKLGEKAFRPEGRGGRIKEPDMIADFIATQWFLWDSVSSIEKAAEGITVGQTWKSKLSIPVPMLMRKARDVTYKLDEIRQTEKGRIAVIKSSYSLAESVPGGWPVPYTGSFQMSGPFGFYRNYKVLDFQGQGEELFNIDAGREEQYDQNYQMQLSASLLFAISDISININIKQNLSTKLLEN